MIIDMPLTNTSEINKRLVESRKEAGVITQGRVMTLVIDATGADMERAIETANEASREHPCRVIVVAPDECGSDCLNAQIRVGADAGSGEVVVLRPSGDQIPHGDTLVTPLLLPDAPVVVWWPGDVPDESTREKLGFWAARRITDTKGDENPDGALKELAESYKAGDTDLVWTRTTRWRALLASALDQVADQTVSRARLVGDVGSPSILLLGAWLTRVLGCEITAEYDASAKGLISITLETPEGPVAIERPDGFNATIKQPGQPDHVLALPSRTLGDVLAEELRRLDDDPVYGEALAFYAETHR